MSVRVWGLCLMLAAGAAACEKSPISPAGSTSVTTPSLVSPANGALVPNGAQPLTLTVRNGVVTDAGVPVSYTFEVATDSAFTVIVQTKDAPQTPGQSSVQLDPLTPGHDYYWRARTKGDDTTGVFSAPIKFTIGAAVTLSTPSAVSPLSGGTAEQKPVLTVTNVTRTGPTGTIAYRFEIATSTAFSSIVASGTVAEGSGGSTSFTSSTSLAADTTFYWRAQAVDATNDATSDYSAPQSFSTILSLDLATVNYQRFVDVSSWPITDRILSVDQDGGDGHICIDHEKSGVWPAVAFVDPGAEIEANQWYFARISGQWYAGAGEWVRPGQICKTGQTSGEIGKDGTWGGPMDTWVPKPGELVGYMMTTPARNWPDIRTLDERSNIVVLPWKVNGRTTP
ncbi:MAG TPA: hypothetical protein VHB78_01215 [Vicinamibacterales bacterium]|nr:hypothetical protein [Vicinamibacterales bacterium]